MGQQAFLTPLWLKNGATGSQNRAVFEGDFLPCDTHLLWAVIPGFSFERAGRICQGLTKPNTVYLAFHIRLFLWFKLESIRTLVKLHPFPYNESANECGYIDAGVIPKFAACASQGVPWFKERGLWQDNSYEPRPGDIIFFDWDNGGQDGSSDHVGIVEKVENGRVYTLEGNSGDSVRRNSYPVGYYEIYGYGTPAFWQPQKKKPSRAGGWVHKLSVEWSKNTKSE